MIEKGMYYAINVISTILYMVAEGIRICLGVQIVFYGKEVDMWVREVIFTSISPTIRDIIIKVTLENTF